MKYSRMDTERLIYEHDKLIEDLKLLEKTLLKRNIKVTTKDRSLKR